MFAMTQLSRIHVTGILVSPESLVSRVLQRRHLRASAVFDLGDDLWFIEDRRLWCWIGERTFRKRLLRELRSSGA